MIQGQKGSIDLMLVGIIITLLGAIGYLVLVQKTVPVVAQPAATITSLPEASSEPSPSPSLEPTPSPTPDLTADWIKYNNKKNSFELKYPANAVINDSVSSQAAKWPEADLYVYAEKINDIKSMPFGYDKANILKDKSALEANDVKGFIGNSTNEIINIKGAIGKKYTMLSQADVCDVQFTREALIYKKDYLIRLKWVNRNVDEVVVQNPDYFTVDSKNCGKKNKAWKDGSSFYDALISDKADVAIQKWFKDFDLIISTFNFSDSNEAAVEKVKLYFINTLVPDSSGSVGCGDEAIGIEQAIEPTVSPLEPALKALLSIRESIIGETGLYNSLGRQNWKLVDASIGIDEVVINLSGKYIGLGTCEDPRIKAQLEQTALQFTTAKKVSIFLDGVSLDKTMSLKGE